MVLRQATIAALDEDGIVVFAIGTAVALLCTVVLWVLGVPLSDWRLQTALVGLAIGVFSWGYCLRRRARRTHGE